EPDASSWPSCEKATDPTKLEWPSKVCLRTPVAGSQSLMPDASSWPSCEKATDST
ncbi:hypothetical protein BDV10DRAFT_168255, partial [Aspergillus recurvatus]